MRSDRVAAIGAASFDHAPGQGRERTGLTSGKVEELTVRAAVDFEQFYPELVSVSEEQQPGQPDVLVLWPTPPAFRFPPATSKWNKIEHRMFSFVSLNWRGKPLESLEVIMSRVKLLRVLVS